MSDQKQASDIVVAERFSGRDLFKKEDWLSIWIAFIIIAVAAVGSLTGTFEFSAAKFASWGFSASEFTDPAKAKGFLGIFNAALGVKLSITFAAFALLFTVGNLCEGKRPLKFLLAFVGMFALVSVVRILSAEATFHHYLEYAFWALLLGLVISNTVKTPEWLKPALRTEFYIKTGLVILGAQVLFSNIQKFGLYGLGIAWGVTPIVIVFMWWYGTKLLKIKNNPLVISVAAGISFEQLTTFLAGDKMQLVRVIPNTAIAIKQSPTLMSFNTEGEEANKTLFREERKGFGVKQYLKTLRG